jgi:hypothetical protein
VIKDSLLLSGD